MNIDRVHIRMLSGGHEVPEDKILSRYHRALSLVPELVPVCDILHISIIRWNRSGYLKRERLYIYIGKTSFGIVAELSN